MRHLKTFGIALAIMISANVFAIEGSAFSFINPSKSFEISKMLEEEFLYLEKNLYGRVVFYLNEEKEIQVHAVICNDPFVREFVTEKLGGKKLQGKQWESGKAYILPVRMKK
ncbi:MAG TPA: hypothetical protein VLN72_03980 [Gillisia sp.]|nr:hypothetical protein [Gillisia sp.]